MRFGFVRIAAAVPVVRVANCSFNTEKMLEMIIEAEEGGNHVVVFPELGITGYTCADLFLHRTLVREAASKLELLLEKTKNLKTVCIAGLPVFADNQLFNCAVVFQKGKILGAVPKTYIPGYSEFYEERWFSPSSKVFSPVIELCGQTVPFGADLLFEARGFAEFCFGIEVCEDLWAPVPPSSYMAMAGATVLFNLSASNELIGKNDYRRQMVRQQSGRCIAAYAFTSAGTGESTTDVVFGGHAMIAEYGTILAESERFRLDGQLVSTEIDVYKLHNDRSKNTSYMEGLKEHNYRKVAFEYLHADTERLTRPVDPHPFVPADESTRDSRCREIFSIQTCGLAKRMMHTGTRNAVIAVSGGLDSTLALLVMTKTFDMLKLSRKGIIGVTMPGFGTTGHTYNNSIELMKSLDITIREIDIKPSCLQHFKDIGHDPEMHDVTYENVQARERTQVIMDIANKVGGLAIGTGDLSELALGWSTYNGDHMSMYSVNCGIPKTLVRFLVQWVADNLTGQQGREVLYRIIDTPISPELLPPDASGRINQKTEDIIGPYELHDFYLYHLIRNGASPAKTVFLAEHAFGGVYDRKTIVKWLRVFIKRFFSQQYKRSCLPDGPKVGTVSLSPRGDWRMPTDAEPQAWMDEMDSLEQD